MRSSVFLALCCWQLSAANVKLSPLHDGTRCGFSAPSGRVVIQAQFRDCREFSDGLAAVQIGERWGYIDEAGAIVIKPQFTSAQRFSDGLAFVTLNPGSTVVIDRRGKVLFAADYYQHGTFSEGLAPVHPVHQWRCFGVTPEISDKCPDGNGVPRDQLWGYIDTTGAMAIPPRFFVAGEFHEGLAYANGGFIDHGGNQVVPGHFSDAGVFVDGVAPVQVEFKAWGYIDKRGGWLAMPRFDRADSLQEGRGLVVVDGKYGYVDRSGTLVVPTQFENALPFSEGRAAVRQGSKWGFIDPAGGVAIPFEFDAAESFEDGSAAVILNSRPTVIDMHGVVAGVPRATLAQTYQRLQGFEVKPGFQGPLNEILPILSVYKEQLRQLAVDAMKSNDDPARVESAIEAKLREAGVRSPDKEEKRPYGLIQSVEVVRAPLQQTLLSVLFHLNLADAIDTSLTIFKRDGNAWEVVDKINRNDYYKWELDAYQMAPPQFGASDAKGSFLMLIASNSGRYGDGGYELWVDLYRVDREFNKQRLFHKNFETINHQIALDNSGFRLETMSFEHDAARGGRRVYPYRYEVRGAQVIRVAPIGFDAHDFLGEWGNLPWDEASRWADPTHLGRIHEYYNKARGSDGYFGGEFAIESCDSQQRMWQIEYRRQDQKDLWFLIERTGQWTFMVRDVGTDKRSGCKDVEWNPRQPFSTMFSKPLEW